MSSYKFIIIEPNKKYEIIPLGTFMYVYDSHYKAWERRMYLDPKDRCWKQTDFSPTSWTTNVCQIKRSYKGIYNIFKYKSLKELYKKRFEEFF